MSEIVAIETVYGGCRFRSRLEARWAVFFDALGIRWEYEPEGFDLPSGRYLPDFMLPDFGYFEVKPDGADGDVRWSELASVTSRDVFVAKGQCFDITRADNSDSIEKNFAGEGWDHHYAWCLCPWCWKVGIEFDGRGARVCGWRAHHETEADALVVVLAQGHSRADDKCYTGDDPKILAASSAARSHRFGT